MTSSATSSASRRRSWIALMFACSIVACAHGPKPGVVPGPVSPSWVQQARARWPDATEQSLAQGRELFVTRCQRCHLLPDRAAYSEERWPKILSVMGPRAKLDDQEKQLVLEFILVERGRTGQGS